MNLNTLETFVWLSRLKNFRRTAEQMRTTQPAISSRVRVLEDFLGTRLLVRSTKEVYLTPEGAEALAQIEEIVELFDRLKSNFKETQQPTGIIRVGAVDTIARTWLPSFVENLRLKYPSVDLEIDVDTTANLLQMLHEGALHLAVAIKPIHGRDFAIQEVCRYPMAWVAHPETFDPDKRYSREDLLGLSLIGYQENTPPYEWMQQYFGHPSQIQMIRNWSNSMTTMIWLAESKLGAAALPPVAVRQDIREGRVAIIPTDQPLPPIPFYVSYRTRPSLRVVELTARVMIDAAEAFAAKENLNP